MILDPASQMNTAPCKNNRYQKAWIHPVFVFFFKFKDLKINDKEFFYNILKKTVL